MFLKKTNFQSCINVKPTILPATAHDSKSFLMNIYAKYKKTAIIKRLRKNGSQFDPGGIQIKTYELFP